METTIYGYYFVIIAERREGGFVAYAPGVGGVYEEGNTEREAIENAYIASCAIFETRMTHNEPITRNSKYLRIITSPPTSEKIEKFRGVMPDGYIFTPACGHMA
jgi:predicted RNase H-like HicB family nuclease